MIIKKIAQNLLFTLFISIFCCVFFAQKTQAESSGGLERIRQCNPNGAVEGLDYNPFYGGKDIQFVMSNPVCAAVFSNSYYVVVVNIARMNQICGTGSPIPRPTPTPISDFIDISKATYRSVASGDAACGFFTTVASSSFAGAIGAISGIYLAAREVFNNSRICGSNWISPNPNQYLNNSPNYKAYVENVIFGKGGYVDQGQSDKISLSDKTYREWYYGGVEATNPDCPDVTLPNNPDGSYPPQKYYMRGLETGNFNCKKYDLLPNSLDPRDKSQITPTRFREFRNAYNCCKKTAREYACIEFNNSYKFCKIGELCTINDIVFTVKGLDNGRLACAETYSLCPYNFALGGGSTQCDFFQDGIYNSDEGRYVIIKPADIATGNCVGKSEIRNADCSYNQKAGRCRNYCQFMTHCTKTDLADFKYVSSITSPYFSEACINFVGDSQNVVSYGTGFIIGSARHFSAPIAQCTKETIENIFYNRAGHTQCKLVDDYPAANQECPGGSLYKKGDRVQAQSFFANLQNQMQFLVRFILSFSIIFFGVKTLIGGGELKKTELMMYIMKIGLVLYFATGQAWQTMFFDGVYGASTIFSQMVFKVQVSSDPEKRDGCQFGNIQLDDESFISQSKYPQGREYLAIWDTLDCKITRYLGFGPEVSTANIAKLIISGWLTGAPGLYFALSLLFFGLMIIAATIRALHIFLSSCIAIVIMVYVSPIVIPLVLFEKTKGIFKGWVTQIISFALQPMILFAYLAIFVSLMDKTLIGSAKFYGDPPFRAVNCREYCQDSLGNTIKDTKCNRVGQKLVTPKADSIACMIDVGSFGKWPGLELIGVSLPFLIDFFTEHTREKILTVTKAVLVTYFLYAFMDEIPGITSQLLGGDSLPSSKQDAVAMFRKIAGTARSIQKRINRAVNKKVISGAKSGYKGLRGALSRDNKLEASGESGADKASSSSGSGADSAGKGGSGADSAGKAGSGADSSGKAGSGSDHTN